MMLNLTLACNVYDRTVALQSGTIKPAGIELNYLPMGVGEIFERQARHAEFDVSEMSLSTYTMLYSGGDRRMIAIPVFTSRKFRHADIFVNTKSGINVPSDLTGKRIGCHEYQQTAGVWQRGHLQHDYGVSPGKMKWFFGPMIAPESNYQERSPITLPDELSPVTIPPDKCLDQMLDSGELDAVIWASEPPSFRRKSENVRRLFPDFKEVEIDYFRRTGIFPIMHTVVIKRDIYERHPWVAASLYKAFDAAKSDAIWRQHDMGCLFSMLPWIRLYNEEQELLMGEDPFAYGLESNRNVLETFLKYMLDQKLIKSPLSVEELFAKETHQMKDVRMSSQTTQRP